VEVSKDLLGPKLDAAFARVTMRLRDDRDALRPEEQQQRDESEPNGDVAIGGNRRYDVQIEDGQDEKKDEVAAAEHSPEVWGFGRFRDANLIRQREFPECRN